MAVDFGESWEASPTSPNTPSLGEGTVSELSLESWSCNSEAVKC